MDQRSGSPLYAILYIYCISHKLAQAGLLMRITSGPFSGSFDSGVDMSKYPFPREFTGAKTRSSTCIF